MGPSRSLLMVVALLAGAGQAKPPDAGVLGTFRDAGAGNGDPLLPAPPVLRSRSAAEACKATPRRPLCRLELLLERIETTVRKSSAVEARHGLTQAYVRLEFAWAFARLGDHARAEELVAAALVELNRQQTDPVHALATRLYLQRVRAALEGRLTPTHGADEAELTSLESMDRYKIDRLRGVSGVVEPWQRLDAITAFWKTRVVSCDDAGVELNDLARTRAISNPSALATKVQNLLQGTPTDDVIKCVVDVLPRLPASDAHEVLNALPTKLDGLTAESQLGYLTDALTLATALGDRAASLVLLTAIDARIQSANPVMVKAVVSAALAASWASKRFSIDDAARLTRLSELAGSDECRCAPVCALLLDAANAQQRFLANRSSEGQATLQRTLGALRATKLVPMDLVPVERAVGAAIGAAPSSVQWNLLETFVDGRYPVTTDSFNTNSHFAISVIGFVDALLVPMVAGEELSAR